MGYRLGLGLELLNRTRTLTRYSVPWLHLHAIYPRSQMRRRWKYTPLSFKSPEWVLRRLSSLPRYAAGVNRLALLDFFKL